MSDAATTISAAPEVTLAVPYVQAIAATAITALGAFVAGLIKRYVGIAVDQAMIDKVDAYVANLAAQEIAKAADNLATAQIDVRSPIVKTLVDSVVAEMPKEMTALGLTPEKIAAKVAAEFGRLQATMTVATPAA